MISTCINYLRSNQLNQIEKVMSIVETMPMADTIPKIVHHTYPNKNLSPELAQNLADLKQNNPDWTFCFYDDDDQVAFIKNYFPNLLSYYASIDADYGAAKADFFRYLLVYKLGGVYLDIKSSLTKPLNQIVSEDTKFILAYWANPSDGMHEEINNPKGEFEQWHVISVAGHPFLKVVIDSVCRNLTVYNPFFDGKSSTATLRVTGPIAYSIAILSVIEKHPHSINTDEALGLVYSIFHRDQATKLIHRAVFKSHYSRSIKPLVKQTPFKNATYIFLCKVKGKLLRSWNKLANR